MNVKPDNQKPWKAFSILHFLSIRQFVLICRIITHMCDWGGMYMTLKYAFKQSLPVMAGYIVLGTGFGVLLASKGYGPGWAFLMSFFIYAGSMQYVAIDLITSGATLITTAIMTLMVNARHLFYGLSMIDRYRHTQPYKPYLIFGLTDETYSLVCSGEVPAGIDQNKYYFYVTLLDQIYWILGSLLGSVLGSIVAFNTTGIDFAMTSLFLVVFTQQWLDTKNHSGAVIGVFCSILCLWLFGPDRFLIPTMILITLLLTVLKKQLENEESHD